MYKPIVCYEIINQKLVVNFECDGKNWNTCSSLPTHDILNWGLWDFDVFEVFLQARGSDSDPYFEFQVSPLGQEFSLKIIEPRKKFEPNKDISFKTVSEVLTDKWQVSFEIDLSSFEIATELYGNFHAVLGPQDKREYFSYQLSAKEEPDFHLPGKMVKL